MVRHLNGIKYKPGRVVFYLRGVWLMIAIVLALCLALTWWLWTVTCGLGFLGGVLSSAIGTISAILGVRAVYSSRRGCPTVTVYDNDADPGSTVGRCWPADEVMKIVVAERLDDDDRPLIQMRLELRDEAAPVVVLQRDGAFRKQIVKVAQHLGARWNAEVAIAPRQAAVALPVFGAVFACLLVAAFLWLAWKEHAVSSWPSVPGTLVRFDLGIHGGTEQGGFEYADPQAEYEYSVNGLQYRSTSVKPSLFHYWSRKSLARDCAGMKPGSRVTVHFDPKAPEQAYLVAVGITRGTIALGIVAASFSLLVVWDYLSRRSSGRL